MVRRMNRVLVTLLLLAAVAAPAALRAADFEGKVRMKITSGSQPAHAIDYAVKSGLLRIELGAAKGPGGVMIMNPAKREMTMLMPPQHMYLVQPLPAPAAAAADEAGAAATTLTATGEKEKILGCDCTKYTVTSKHGTTDLWLTEQLGSFSAMTPPGPGAGPGAARNAAAPAWAKALEGKNFFPMRIVSHGANGAGEMRMEVESVEPQSLPDSLFTPPEDYRKLDMGGMMRGLGGMQP
jgi:hypothetical protein